MSWLDSNDTRKVGIITPRGTTNVGRVNHNPAVDAEPNTEAKTGMVKMDFLPAGIVDNDNHEEFVFDVANQATN